MNNSHMIVMIGACVISIFVVYLLRRLSVDYSWVIAIVAGAVTQLSVIFVGDYMFLQILAFLTIQPKGELHKGASNSKK